MPSHTPVLPTAVHDWNGAAMHGHGHKKSRNWLKRFMNKHEITPQKALGWSCFLVLFFYLLHSYLTAVPVTPIAPFRPVDPHATRIVEGKSVRELDRRLERSTEHLVGEEGQANLQAFYQDRLKDHAGDTEGLLKVADEMTWKPIVSIVQQLEQESAKKEYNASSPEAVLQALLAQQGPAKKPKKKVNEKTPAAVIMDQIKDVLKEIPDVVPPGQEVKPTPRLPPPAVKVEPKPTTDTAAQKAQADKDTIARSDKEATAKADGKEKDAATTKATKEKESDAAADGDVPPAVKPTKKKPAGPVEPDAPPASVVPAPKDGFVSLTQPKKPLDLATVDVSKLYDSPARKAKRDAFLAASPSEPLPGMVTARQINNVIARSNTPEKPLNEEHREVLSESLSLSVPAPGVVASFTSPDGGFEMSIFLDHEGRVGYGMKMHGRYSQVAKQMVDDQLAVDVDELSGTFLLPALVELSLDEKMCLFQVDASGQAKVNVRLTKGFSFWHPMPKAERSEYGESFNMVTLWNDAGDGAASKKNPCGQFAFEFRLFNIGFGARGIVHPTGPPTTPVPTDALPGEGTYLAVSWSLGLRLQEGAVDDTQCIANNMEEPFELTKCREMKTSMMTPVSIGVAAKLSGGGLKEASSGKHSKGPSHLALLQAAGPAFIRSTAKSTSEPSKPLQTQLIVSTKGEAPLKPADLDVLGVIASPIHSTTAAAEPVLVTPTSWHVVLFAAGLKHLGHANHLVSLLCDPPATAHPDRVDSRWVPTGKLIRITKWSTEYSKTVIDWAEAHNFPLVHFDAGWYGNEYKKESSAKAVLPDYQANLDLTAVGTYANQKGIRVCLYVNELALRDTAELSVLFPSWGISGIKFGFVLVDDARAMRILHQRILAFGAKGMWINVHDSYRPRGLTRTYPFLVAQEGVRGEERKPDATHHTILPFVRLLQGSADYTPRFLNGAGLKCTKAHQLSIPMLLYSPIQSLFWAEPIDAVSNSVASWNKELVVWTRMPSTWDDTRWLAAELGELASVARRNGRDWYIATITNTNARQYRLDLNSIWRDVAGHPDLPATPAKEGYLVHSYKDGPYKGRTDPFTIKVAKRQFMWLKPPKDLWVDGKEPKLPKAKAAIAPIKDGILSLDMAPSGGHTLYLTPATPEALEEVE